MTTSNATPIYTTLTDVTHPRGAARLRDFVEGQKALAGAPMRRAGRQPPQILRRLAPARGVDMQHAEPELKTVIHLIQMGKPGPKNHISQTGRGLVLQPDFNVDLGMRRCRG